MNVLNKKESVITNYEVLALLRRQAAERDEDERRQKLPGAKRTAPAVTQWRSQQEVRAMRLDHRTLVSPLPTFSTHGESRMLAGLVDWEQAAARTGASCAR